MFGLQGTNLKATLSVLNDKGENTVITSVAKEDKGWFNFSVAGFTFSSPTIRLKLEESPAVSPTPEQTKAPTTKKITCVKGKVKKVVSGTNPKCPTGFKKG